MAWRVLGAEHWGTPQPRRRIFLVADFARQRAGEILFKSEGLHGFTAEGGKARAGTASNFALGFTAKSFAKYVKGVGTLKASGGDLGGGSETLVLYPARGFAVRKLTPTECERMQGFLDGWTACGAGSVEISDTQRYKALGNSVVLLCVESVLAGIMNVG